MIQKGTASAVGVATVALIVILFLFGAGGAFAGPGHGGFGMHRGHGEGPLGHGFGPMRALSKLDLSAEQRSQIRERFEAAQTEIRPLFEALAVAREALHEWVHAAAPEESTIRSAAAEVARIEADLAVARSRVHQQIREVLTEEQRAELDQMKSEMRERFREHRGGPPAELDF